eukprot:3898864-Amphidinium_carterae.2
MSPVAVCGVRILEVRSCPASNLSHMRSKALKADSASTAGREQLYEEHVLMCTLAWQSLQFALGGGLCLVLLDTASVKT